MALTKHLPHAPSFEKYYSWALQKNPNVPHWEVLDHWLDLPIEKQSNSKLWTLPGEGEISHAPEMRVRSDEPQFSDEDCETFGRNDPNKVHSYVDEAEEEQVHVNAKCPQCNHVFDYLSEPEAGMGYVKCPKCHEPVDQSRIEADEDEQESGQMVTNDQTTQMISTQQPVHEYREEEEQPQNPNQQPKPQNPNQQQQTQASSPEEQQLRQRVAQLAAKNPQLGLTVNYTGKQNNSKAWYVFSSQTEKTPLGIQAKKWGGFSNNELNDMISNLDEMGEEGIKSYFSKKV